MKLNLSKGWKKIHEADDHAVFKSDGGHELKVAKAGLSPHNRAEIAKLPQFKIPHVDTPTMMANGGPAKLPHFSDGTTDVIPGVGKRSDVEAFQAGVNNTPKKSTSSDTETKDTPNINRDAAEASTSPDPGLAAYNRQYRTQAVQSQAKGGMIETEESPTPKPSSSPAPFGTGSSSYDPSNPVAQGVSKIFKAHGGEVCKHCGADPTQQHLLPGDKIPNKIEKQVVRKNYAQGTDNVNSSTVQDTPEQIVQDADNTPAQSVPQSPAPTTDANQATYNSLLANAPEMASMQSKTGTPDAEQSTDQTISPDGSVKQLNVPVMQQAIAQNKSQDLAAQAQQVQQSQAIATENEARQAAGLPLLPDPNSAQPLPQTTSAGGPPPADQGQQEQPGDKELDALQAQSAQSVMQKGAQAKQMTLTALWQKNEQDRKALEALGDINVPSIASKFGEKSFPGKMAALLGFALGGGAAGVTGGPNQALAMMQSGINADIAKQKNQMGVRQTFLSQNMQMFKDMPDAIRFTQAQMMDQQLHQLVQLAKKYPNNPRYQQTLAAIQMAGYQSKSQLLDTAATNTAFRNYVDHIQDPGMKIQFNPMMSPEQKNTALKDLGTYKNMEAARANILNASDQVSKMALAGTFSPNQRDALLEPLLAQAVKDSEGRITPQDVPMIKALLPKPTDMGNTRAIKRQQLVKFMSSKMNFPSLTIAGINTATPPPVTTGAPRIK